MENIKAEYPIINTDNTCFVGELCISNISIDEQTKNVTGYTINPDTGKKTKCFYNTATNTWYFGKRIGNYNNLISLADRTEEERRIFGSIGGLKAKENRDNKKSFNDLARLMLEQTLNEKQVSEILGTSTNMLLDNSVASVMIARMIQEAMGGSFKCAEFVRDTAGYKPKNEIEVQADIMTDADRSLLAKLEQRTG